MGGKPTSGREIKDLLDKMIKDGRGSIKTIVYTWRDGIPIDYTASTPSEAEFLSVAVSAVVGALESLGSILNSGIRRIDVELENGQHIIINPVNGAILAISTSERPNLGLIHIIIRTYEKKIKQFGKIGHVGGEE